MVQGLIFVNIGGSGSARELVRLWAVQIDKKSGASTFACGRSASAHEIRRPPGMS